MSCTDPLSQRIGHDTGGGHVAAITHVLMAVHGRTVPADFAPVALTLWRMLCLSALRTVSCDKGGKKVGQTVSTCINSARVVLNR